MHPLYDEANQIAEELQAARLEVAQLTFILAQNEYELTVVKARVERKLIKQVGDEKRLGATVAARERVFTLARDADEEYLLKLKRYNQSELALEQARVEVLALQDKLSIVLATLRIAGENG